MRENPRNEREQLEPKFLSNENSLPSETFLLKPQPYLHSPESRWVFFAGPKNTEANLSFQRTKVFFVFPAPFFFSFLSFVRILSGGLGGRRRRSPTTTTGCCGSRTGMGYVEDCKITPQLSR